MKKSNAPITEQYGRLADLLENEYESPTAYLLSRLFITHISAFEIFLQETASAVIKLIPHKLASTTFTLEDILNAENTEFLVSRAIESWLNKTLYGKPKEYIKEFDKILSIDTSNLNEYWKIFIEAKARRDLGVHSSWKCNATYLRKMREAEIQVSETEGAVLLPVEDKYHEGVEKALIKLAEEISRAIVNKYSKDLLPELESVINA